VPVPCSSLSPLEVNNVTPGDLFPFRPCLTYSCFLTTPLTPYAIPPSLIVRYVGSSDPSIHYSPHPIPSCLPLTTTDLFRPYLVFHGLLVTTSFPQVLFCFRQYQVPYLTSLLLSLKCLIPHLPCPFNTPCQFPSTNGLPLSSSPFVISYSPLPAFPSTPLPFRMDVAFPRLYLSFW